MNEYGQSGIPLARRPCATLRPDREQSLLDAGRDLFLRYGFDKTTIAEIARGASVSKGAVYLHFASKEQLFEALLGRELSRFNEDWLARVDADERGGTIAGMFKHLLRAIHASPLVGSIFKRDRSVIGSYLQRPNGMFKRRRGHTRLEFVERMQAAGAMRADADPHVTAHIMNMLSYGLVSMDAVMDPEDIPSIERLIDGIGDLLDRAFTPPEGGNSEAGKAILHELSDAARKRSGQCQS